MEGRISIHFLSPKQNFMKIIGNPYFFSFPFLRAMSKCRAGKISLCDTVNKIWGFLVVGHKLNVSPHAVSKDQQGHG